MKKNCSIKIKSRKEQCCNKKLLTSFSKPTKIIMHSGILIFAGLGTIGMWMENWMYGIAYLCFVIFSFRILLMNMLCVYCPYPFEHNTCIFFPSIFFKNIKRKTGKAPFSYRYGHLIAFGGLLLIPQPWIYNNLYIAIGFWISFTVIAFGLLVTLCGRCKYQQCPFNHAPKELFEKESEA